MTQLKRRNVVKRLKGKGFKSISEKSNDLWFGLMIDGEFVPQIKTFVSGGGQRPMIFEDNIHNMTHELHMDNKKQFLDYIKCSYKYHEYIEDLQRKDIV